MYYEEWVPIVEKYKDVATKSRSRASDKPVFYLVAIIRIVLTLGDSLSNFLTFNNIPPFLS